MFTLSSDAGSRSAHRAARAFLSLALHVAAGVGAVEATRRAVTAPDARPRESRTIFVVPSRPAAAAATPAPASPAAIDGASPPVSQFTAPATIPTGIPPVDLRARPVDPARMFRPILPPGCAACAPGSAPDAIFAEDAVDRPVEIVSQRAPDFPPFLREAGLPGRVLVQYVVDTMGVVEPGSVRILEATHDAFAANARAALLQWRFRPALARGTAVRQLVQQAIRFAIR